MVHRLAPLNLPHWLCSVHWREHGVQYRVRADGGKRERALRVHFCSTRSTETWSSVQVRLPSQPAPLGVGYAVLLVVYILCCDYWDTTLSDRPVLLPCTISRKMHPLYTCFAPPGCLPACPPACPSHTWAGIRPSTRVMSCPNFMIGQRHNSHPNVSRFLCLHLDASSNRLFAMLLLCDAGVPRDAPVAATRSCRPYLGGRCAHGGPLMLHLLIVILYSVQYMHSSGCA